MKQSQLVEKPAPQKESREQTPPKPVSSLFDSVLSNRKEHLIKLPSFNITKATKSFMPEG